MQKGFDSDKYLEEQSKYILERVNNYDKLYLEFGGKLISDLHAKRVLPGFDENSKIKLLQKLADKAEVIICLYAQDIERNKIRGDFGITYDMDVLRLIDDLRDRGLTVNSVVITRYENQPAASAFITKLERRDIKVYKHVLTKGYPTDVDTIVSDDGYGKNSYIETTKPIVVVTAPGPGSGKLATCLSQLYHEYKRGNAAGYSKFETFPVWNMPLKHPINIAYEAATVDLKDVNMIDPFHLETYGSVAINYNRDIEAFPLLRRIIEKITGKASVYQSPTDMGVNRLFFGIVDDAIVRRASEQEVIRRYFKTACDYKKGYLDKDTLERSEMIMKDMGLSELDRAVVRAAREHLEKQKQCAHEKENIASVAIELDGGEILTGKRSNILNATAAALLNAIKFMAGIPDSIHLLSPVIIEHILSLKKDLIKRNEARLSCDEALIALSISAATNDTAKKAMSKLVELQGTQMHSTSIVSTFDEQTLQKLGVDITCDPLFPTDNLYYSE